MSLRDELTRPIAGIEHRTAQEVFDIMCDRIRLSAIEPAGVGVETPPPSTHVAVTEAAKRYLAAIDSAPENDIWDTWDGEPAEGAPKTASDASWAEHGQKIESHLSELRAALATTEGKDNG